MGGRATGMSKDATVRVRGVVIAADWDIADNVTGVAIRTADDKEFVVAPYGKGLDLIENLDEEVEAEGTLRKDWDGTLVIHVRSYTLDVEDAGGSEDEGDDGGGKGRMRASA